MILLLSYIGGAIIAATVILTPSCVLLSPYIKAVKHYEGFYAAPYRCPAGVWTIGYGHTKGVTEDTPEVTELEAHILLLGDLVYAATQVLRLAGDALEQAGDGEEAAVRRFVALTSWTFNLGEGNLATSTMLKRIWAGRWDDAAREMLRWNKARVKGRMVELAGLTKRRRSEAHFFRTGEVVLY